MALVMAIEEEQQRGGNRTLTTRIGGREISLDLEGIVKTAAAGILLYMGASDFFTHADRDGWRLLGDIVLIGLGTLVAENARLKINIFTHPLRESLGRAGRRSTNTPTQPPN